MSEDQRIAEYQTRLQSALEALQKMRARLESVEGRRTEPIAVIGIGCRYPGDANDPDAFWQLLLNGVDAIREIPPERWDVDALYDPDTKTPGKISTRYGGFLNDVDQFDAQFFGISPREARSMDPQQRLLLEVSWSALEHAGINPLDLHGSQTGVFVGVTCVDYARLQDELQGPDLIDAYRITGSSLNSSAGRLSYFLGLHGPSMAIDTACSSSLVAVHNAVRSLRDGEASLALACGVNLILSPEISISATKSSMLSPDGRCKTFDSRADGYVRSEGCGVVVLKRLSDAQADGDPILALIRGSAVNQDGFSSGLTVPNKLAQEAVIRAALKNAGLKPADIQYVEAHGTGTSLGDPIEVRALSAVLSEGRPAGQPFRLGSVKTNIGHTESAAGVAGLIKTVLSLHHGVIPPHLHFQTPTPKIDWDQVPAVVPTQPEPWTGAQRYAAVSAFGASGTNAHVVLASAPAASMPTPSAPVPAPVERPLHLLTLSAKNEAALSAAAAQLKTYLDRLSISVNDISCADICYSLNVGRAHFNQRLAVTAATPEALSALLADPGALARGAAETGSAPKIAFLYTGHGSQYVNMGRGLYESAPVFRQAVLDCEAALQPYLDTPITKMLYPAPGSESGTAALWEGMKYTQPAQFTLAYGLTQLWQSWGIEPGAVIGHSVGEYAAACAAGVMDLAGGAKLVAARGRLMESLPQQGVMAAVFTDEATIAKAIQPYAGQVAIAVINGPTNIVISGSASVVEKLQAGFEAQEIKSKRLDVAQASHSPVVDPMLDVFEAIASTITYHQPRIDFFSCLNAQTTMQIDQHYWRTHQRQTVRFGETIQALLDQGYTHLVEIGPAPTLITIAQRNLDGGGEGLEFYPSLRKGQDDWAQMLGSLSGLYVRGAAVDWRGFDRPYTRSRLRLPTYPFQRQRYWVTPAPARLGGQSGELLHPLLGARLPSAVDEIIFENHLSAQSPAFLADHVVQDQVILPATAYIEMLLAAGRAVLNLPDGACQIDDLVIHAPLRLSENTPARVQTIARRTGERVIHCQVFSLASPAEGWRLHAGADLRALTETPPALAVGGIQARIKKPAALDVTYQQLAEHGLRYGPAFRGMRSLSTGKDETLARIEPTEAAAADLSNYILHPALLDAALQAVGPLLPQGDKTYLPFSVASIKVTGRAAAGFWSHASRKPGQSAGNTVEANLNLFGDDGRALAVLEGFSLKLAVPASLDSWLYEVEWQKAPKAALPAPAELVDRLRPALDGMVAEPQTAAYALEFTPRMDALCAALVQNALVAMGWPYAPGDVLTTGEAANQLQVGAQHEKLLNRLLEILAEDGLLSREGAAWRVLKAPAQTNAAALADELRAAFPDAQIEVDMVQRIGAELAPAMQGRCDPLELLFPGGSLDETEKLYRDAPFVRNFNHLVAQALREIRQGWPAGRALRVLEVGAGTGGTTARALEQLAGLPVEYTFSDVSPLFLNKARQKFAAYDFVRYQALDIEKDPLEQGFAPGSFDLILATNVLHATPELAETLRRAGRLLAPGGLLLVLEGTGRQRFADIIVGLTPGWWAFRDTDVRPSYAMIPPAHWLRVLAESGLEMARSLSGETVMANEALLIAQAPPRIVAGETGSWIILGGAHPAGAALAEQLRVQAQKVLVARAAERYAVQADDYQVNPALPADFEALVRAAGSCRGVIDLWALEPGADQMTMCGGLLYLAQALAASGATCPLWVVTQGAQPAGGAVVNPQQATLWGLSKVLNQEHPDLLCRAVDLDASPLVSAEENSAGLWLEISMPDAEDQIALRGSDRYTARLVRARQAASHDPAVKQVEPVKLAVSEAGDLDHLAYRPAARRAPGPGEVEIQVAASGLGFRDVLLALGMYPGGGELGSECAGTVTAVGAGVDHLRPGDAVFGVAAGSFASYVTASAQTLVKKPASLSFAEAAAVPSAFLTTTYALHHLAQIKAGDRVLIHAAAGGVGLAAVQLAQQAGAEIFATAGSPAKRAMLKNLGVPHVMNSRTLDFADEIMRITAGKGVDVVLNSLADDFIAKSVSVLAGDGRFIEIGKRGIWSAEQFAQVKPDATYAVVDLLLEARQDRELVAGMLQSITQGFADGSLTPLPMRVFSTTQVSEAFRLMAAGRHTGKLVIVPEAQPLAARADAAYLITGGLGGLGLAVAEWLAKEGARHIALVGRSAPREKAVAALQKLANDGVQVMVFQADVSQPEALAGVFAQVAAEMPPLKGVIHAAGALDDGIIRQQTWSRFETVFAPKVRGGWNLHQLTKGMHLDFFVLFSSVVSMLGSAGQANHVAACTFLDMLAHYRRARGLPAQSIGWGPWEQIGAAAEREVADRLHARGIETIPPALGIAALAQVMRAPSFEHVGVVPVNWARFNAQSATPFFTEMQRLAEEQKARAQAQTAPPKAADDLWKRLESAPESKRKNLLLAHVRDQALKVLTLPADFALDQRQPLQELGLDSLMAVELRNLLGKGLPLARALPATLVFDYPTPEALTRYLAEELFEKAAKGEAAKAPPPPATTAAAPPAASLPEEELTDEEAEALLLAELDDIQSKKTGKSS